MGSEKWSGVSFSDLGAPYYASPAKTVGGVPVRRVDLRGPEVYHIPNWKQMSDPKRIKTLRNIVLEYGRDPRVAEVANRALAQANVPARAYKQQAAVLLAWVHNNVRYINEPGERLQSPEYTLRQGFGDCDDLSILLGALYETVRLPWKFVLSGTNKKTGQTVRWIEGQPFPRNVGWAHIYVCVGRPTFRPTRWSFAEPSLKGAKLGWDVVQAKNRGERIPVPELGYLGAAEAPGTAVAIVPPTDPGFDLMDEMKRLKGELGEELHWRKLAVTVTVGAVVSIATTYLVEYMVQKMRGKKRGRR